MVKNILKIIIINIIIICLLFISLELIFRALFPEFKDQVHSKSLTCGKNVYYDDFMGMHVRVPYAGYKLIINKNIPILLIVGDSITNGYGSAYEDIYWQRLERLLNITNSIKLKIMGCAAVGNDLSDAVKQLELLASQGNNRFPIKYIMYQFNFNDVTPFGNAEIKSGKHLKGFERTHYLC